MLTVEFSDTISNQINTGFVQTVLNPKVRLPHLVLQVLSLRVQSKWCTLSSYICVSTLCVSGGMWSESVLLWLKAFVWAVGEGDVPVSTQHPYWLVGAGIPREVEKFNFLTSLFLIQLPWGSSSPKEMPTGNSQWTYCSSRHHSLPGKLKDREEIKDVK